MSHLAASDDYDVPPGVLHVKWVAAEQAAGVPAPQPVVQQPEVPPRPLPPKPVAHPKPKPVKVKPHQVTSLLTSVAEATSADQNVAARDEAAAEKSLASSSDASGAPRASAEGRADGDSGDPSPPNYDADYLSNPAPEYPPLSRKQREQGLTSLRVLVSAEGKATRVELERGSGYERLDEAAITAVKDWRFVPAQLKGKAVSGWVVIPIRFILRN